MHKHSFQYCARPPPTPALILPDSAKFASSFDVVHPQVGLGFFLVAHICYISAFLASGVRVMQPHFFLGLIIFVGYGIFALIVLLRGIASDEAVLKGCVAAYITVICTMVISACGWDPVQRENAHPALETSMALATRAQIVGVLAAIVFIFSDTVLGFSKFRPDMVESIAGEGGRKASGFVIMVTYYVGQAFFCWSGEWLESALFARVTAEASDSSHDHASLLVDIEIGMDSKHDEANDRLRDQYA